MKEVDFLKKHVLDHYRNPRNYGEIPDADVVSEEANLSCGDEVKFYLKFDRDRLIDARFTSRSCAICTASASMLTETIKGKAIEHVLNTREEDVLSLFGGFLDQQRKMCAVLPLLALKKGVKEFNERRKA